MRATSGVKIAAAPVAPADDGYDTFLRQMRDEYRLSTALDEPVFTTDATGLWETYLRRSPPDDRPFRTCNACRHFVERYGGLVTIGRDGSLSSAIWPKATTGHHVPVRYRAASKALRTIVEAARVTGVFLSSDVVWGTPETGKWRHFAVAPRSHCSDPLITAGQAMAAKREEYGMLQRGLEEFPLPIVREALKLLESGHLYRSEKCIGVARWLVALHEKRAGQVKRVREALTWAAIAEAPPGFAHVRSGMIGTLLEDVASKLPFPTIKERFDAKMNPLQYQRPTAPPAAGNIAQAEKIVATLRSAGALDRRFAKLADVAHLVEWELYERPKGGVRRPDGVFSHVRPRTPMTIRESVYNNCHDVEAPPVVITWVKFKSTVMPHAREIDIHVPAAPSNYAAFVTARDLSTPPILQWDSPSQRNPISWYLYYGGSLPSRWGLFGGRYHRVNAIVRSPGTHPQHGEFACMVIAGAKDIGYSRGAGLFPENLRSEYHGVRATIEAYSLGAIIDGKNEAEVCGQTLSKGPINVLVRVISAGGTTSYKIDRWD